LASGLPAPRAGGKAIMTSRAPLALLARFALPLFLTLAAGSAAAQIGAVPAPVQNPPGAQPPSSTAADIRRATIERDAEPTVELFRKGEFTFGFGALMQVQGAFYVGDGSRLQFNDPADSEGFRVRRTRFGFGGSIIKNVDYYFAVDLKDTVAAAYGGDRGSEILDAHFVWSPLSNLHLTVGVDKVPLSISLMQSSGRLELIERSLSVDLLAPVRRVGMSVSGEQKTGDFGTLRYAAGLYNATDGVTSGNRLSGVAGVGYAQYDMLAPQEFVPAGFGLSIGGAYMYEDGPGTDSHRIGGNLQIWGFRTKLVAELLYEKSSPDAAPTTTPIAGDVTRWGASALLTVFLWRDVLQFAGRFEYFSDNDVLPTFGKQILITGGLNYYIARDRLKVQLNYLRRMEREGPGVANDIAFLQIQASF